MNKKQLVEAVAGKTAMNRSSGPQAVDAVREVVAASLTDGESVALPGFGTFKVRNRSAIRPQSADARDDCHRGIARAGLQVRKGVAQRGELSGGHCRIDLNRACRTFNRVLSGCKLMPIDRRNAVRDNLSVSLRDNTDTTTSGHWYRTAEGRYAACLEREPLPPDYGRPVPGRLVATQVSLEPMEQKNPS